MPKRYPRDHKDVKENIEPPSRSHQEAKGMLSALHDPKKCRALNSRGLPCARVAKREGFCTQHYKKNFAQKPSLKHGVYSAYLPSLKDAFDSVASLNDQMVEEAKLIRVLLTSVLVKYENKTANKSDVLMVIDSLRKVLEYQAKFLPEKRPIDIESVDAVINKITNIIVMKVENPKVLDAIVKDMSVMLSGVIEDAEEKSRNARKNSS